MHAFIVTGDTPSSRADFIAEKNSIGTELIHIATEKSSITIKQVQELSTPLSISPRLPRIVWIEEANLLTIPAQNALLKMLEEPPLDTTFYLTCASKTSLLPTILSRSKVIALTYKAKVEDSNILRDLKTIMAMTPGDRIANIVKRDRSESISWMESIESSLKSKLHDTTLPLKSAKMLAKIAKLAINAHIQYSANCSVSLVTQNFYLLLPHTHSTS